MVNFYRVRAAAILKEAAEFGEKNDMEGARNLLIQGTSSNHCLNWLSAFRMINHG
jgi:hypothetical protein